MTSTDKDFFHPIQIVPLLILVAQNIQKRREFSIPEKLFFLLLFRVGVGKVKKRKSFAISVLLPISITVIA
jgi:hypothetical protein